MRFIRKTSYNQDIRLIKHSGHLLWYGLLLMMVFLAPLFTGNYLLGELSQVFIFAIAGCGLMLLVGYTGLVSLGHGAFLALRSNQFWVRACLQESSTEFPCLSCAGLRQAVRLLPV